MRDEIQNRNKNADACDAGGDAVMSGTDTGGRRDKRSENRSYEWRIFHTGSIWKAEVVKPVSLHRH